MPVTWPSLSGLWWCVFFRLATRGQYCSADRGPGFEGQEASGASGGGAVKLAEEYSGQKDDTGALWLSES